MLRPKPVRPSVPEDSTRRYQLIAIGLVLLVALIAAAVSLATPKPRITGNNGVSPVTFLATVTDASGPLCTRGVDVPPETKGVRLWLGTYATSGVRMTMRTFSGEGRALGSSRPAAFDDGARVIFRLPQGQRDDLKLCWSADHKVAFPGEANGAAAPDQVSVLGKKEVAGDISIEYMRGGKQSALAAAPTVFDRASLYRPSWVGPWTYYAVFLAVFAVLLVGILLLLRIGRSELPASRRLMIAIAAIAFANAALWGLITPAFNTPDELSHFTYVETLAGGELPQHSLASKDDPGNSYLPSTVYVSALTANRIIQNSYNKEPWSPALERSFEAEYEKIKKTDKRYGLTPANVYSPAYYAPAVVPWAIGGAGNIFDRLYLVRLYSALWLALGVFFVMLFVREMLPSVRWAPAIAGLSVAFLPMAAHLGGGVSNDNMMVAACALTLWLGARVMRRGITFSRVLGLIFSMLLAYAAKPTSLGIVPAVGFALLITAWRSERRWADLRTCVLAALAPLAAGLLLVAIFGGGGGAPAVAAGTVPLRPVTPTGYLSYVWQWYLPSVGSMDEYWVGLPPAFSVFFRGFVAQFNSLDTVFADGFYKLLAVAAAGLFALVLRAVWERRSRLREQWPLVVYPAAAVLGTMLVVNTTGYLLWTKDGQLFAQGRYLFPALGVFGLYVAAAALGAGRRLAIPLASAVVVSLGVINIAGMILSLGRFYL